MARVLKRGDVLWADLGTGQGHEQRGRRPVLVLSRDVFNSRSGTVIAAAITSQRPGAGFPLTLRIDSTSMPRESWVKIGQIRTLSARRLGRRITRLRPEQIADVVEGLFEIIGE